MVITPSALDSSKKFITGNGIVDSAGNCVIEFPPTPVGMYWTGSVTIFNSPGGVQWMVNVNQQTVDVCFGQQTVSGIQVGPPDQLFCRAIGLTSYIGQTINATFSAIETTSETTQLQVSGHDSYNPLSSYARTIINQHIPSGQNLSATLASTDRSLVVSCYPSQAGDVTNAGVAACIGLTTGIDYLALAVAYRPLGSTAIGTAQTGPVIIPIWGSLESGISLSIMSGGPTQVVVIATPDPYLWQPYQEPMGTVILNGTTSIGPNGPGAIPVSGAVSNQTVGPAHADSMATGSVTNGTFNLLPVPAAGQAYWIKNTLLQCGTTAAALAFIRIQTHTSGYMLSGAWQAANGTYAQAAFTDMVIADGIDGVNTTATACGFAIVYRTISVT